MGIIIISVFLLLLGGILIRSEKIRIQILGAIAHIIGIMGTLIAGGVAITGVDVDKFDNEYTLVSEELEIYHNSSVMPSYKYLSDLDDNMEVLNAQIENNRKYAGTFWLGWFHDKKIAQYEPFDIEKELSK